MLLLAFVLKWSEFVILLRIPNMWYNLKKLLQACHINAGIVLDAKTSLNITERKEKK